MKKFNKILHYVSLKSDCSLSLNRAFELADENNAELTIVSVVPEVPSSVKSLIPGYDVAEISEALIHEQQQQLKEVALPYRDRGVTVYERVLQGSIYLALIREVLKNKHDLVIKMRDDHPDYKNRIGTLDMRILRKCPCPVWLVHPEAKKNYHRILAAINPMAEDAIGKEINTKVFELASSLSLLEKSELHIVSVWDIFGESFIKRRANDEDFKDLQQKALLNIRKKLDNLIETFDFEVNPNHIHLIKGAAMYTIPSFVNQMEIDFVVMGSIARTGILNGFLIGNTAEKIVNSINCSLLTVKPKSFVTPITLDKEV